VLSQLDNMLTGLTRNTDDHPEFDRDDDGELLMDWSPSPGRVVTLSLRKDGRLSYAVLWDGEKLHGAAQMPPELADDERYAALEKEHFGDPEKQTGIYAPRVGP
jgi:hypothetical protein